MNNTSSSNSVSMPPQVESSDNMVETTTAADKQQGGDRDDGARSHSTGSGNNKHHHRDVPLVQLELQHVTYAPVVSGSKTKDRVTVLNDISTVVEPYQLTAWMGPSGSGKTSLISVAADLTKPGDILGENSLITVNGEEGEIPKRLVGVVWQDDLLLSNLTVEETLYFAARLKTPQETSNATVRELVNETMSELGLLHIRDSLVGNTTHRGISGGERKRVAVGVELVVRPSLILLDEPTSGLDATTAQSLIQTLKDLCKNGHSIAVVIHQPRTTIYNLFDHLLLLSRGHVLFNGHPSRARCYLESCGYGMLPPETGLADWMMDIVTEDERRDKGGSLLAQHWRETNTNDNNYKEDCHHDSSVADADNTATSDRRFRLERRLSSLGELHSAPKYHTSFRMQLRLLTHRTLKQQRGERLTTTAVILQVVYLFFTALFWWRMPDTTGWIFERNSLLFFMLIAQANGIVIAAVTVFQRERALLKRERAKKMFQVSSFFVAKTIADMTNNVLLPLLYSMIVYWTAGFRSSVSAYLKNAFAFYWTFSTAQSMGLFLSILIPNPQIALVLAPPITLFFMIMGGFYIPFENMHPGVEWLSYVSFARYGYSALIINEYEGRDIPCGEDVSVTVGISGQCPLPGEEVVSSLGITGALENYWVNVGVVILLQLLFRLAAYVWLRRSR